MTRRTPDRFEKMVQKKALWSGDNLHAPNMYAADAAALLRREHAGVVRAVKKFRKSFERDTRKGFAPYRNGYLASCDDILTMLTKRKGGK